jgi:hypothetical protein
MKITWKNFSKIVMTSKKFINISKKEHFRKNYLLLHQSEFSFENILLFLGCRILPENFLLKFAYLSILKLNIFPTRYKYLNQLKFGLEHTNSLGETAFFQAFKQSDLLIAEMLVKNGANMYTTDTFACNVSLNGINKPNCIELIKFLIDNGYSIDHQDVDGFTILMHVCNHGIFLRSSISIKIIDYILEHKPNLDLQTSDGWTALMMAARSNRKDIFLKLLNSGSNRHLTTNTGLTADSLYSEYMI